MANTNKITKRTVLTAIMENVTEEGIGGISQADVKAFCAKEIENLDKRAASSGVSKKEQEARIAEEAIVLTGLSDVPKTVFQLTREIPECNSWSVQKCSAVLKRCAEKGQATKLTVKGVTYYKAVVA